MTDHCLLQYILYFCIYDFGNIFLHHCNVNFMNKFYYLWNVTD